MAYALEERLFHLGYVTVVLDGDGLRDGLCRDLGFSAEDRQENIRRAAEVMKLFLEEGLIVLGAFIAPRAEDRELTRSILQSEEVIEAYCRCPVEVCEARDRKGFYRMAREGAIECYTGVSAPYEEPVGSDLVLNTGSSSLESCLQQILSCLESKGLIIERKTAEGT